MLSPLFHSGETEAQRVYGICSGYPYSVVGPGSSFESAPWPQAPVLSTQAESTDPGVGGDHVGFNTGWGLAPHSER